LGIFARYLEGYVVHLGAILGHPGAIFGHPGALLGGLEGDLGAPGPIFGRPEAILELSYIGKHVNLIMLILHWFYMLFLRPGGHLGAMLEGFEGDLRPPGAHLGTSCGHL